MQPQPHEFTEADVMIYFICGVVAGAAAIALPLFWIWIVGH